MNFFPDQIPRINALVDSEEWLENPSNKKYLILRINLEYSKKKLNSLSRFRLKLDHRPQNMSSKDSNAEITYKKGENLQNLRQTLVEFTDWEPQYPKCITIYDI